jgi:hypothetical protein
MVLADGSWIGERHNGGVLTMGTVRPEVTGDVLSPGRQSWRLWPRLGTSMTLYGGWCLRRCSIERTGWPRATATMPVTVARR